MSAQGAKVEQAASWVGLNLRAERTDLDPQQFATAKNADAHKFVGVISLRNGRTAQFSSALTDLVIRTLSRVNGFRYRVAGTNLYRAETSIDDYRTISLSSILRTSIVPFKPLNDSVIWAFIIDRDVAQKDNGTITRRWGLPAPDAHSGRDDSVSTYTYRLAVSQVRFDGTSVAHESNPTQITVTE